MKKRIIHNFAKEIEEIWMMEEVRCEKKTKNKNVIGDGRTREMAMAGAGDGMERCWGVSCYADGAVA